MSKDTQELLLKFLEFADEQYGQSLNDPDGFYCSSDEEIIDSFIKAGCMNWTKPERIEQPYNPETDKIPTDAINNATVTISNNMVCIENAAIYECDCEYRTTDWQRFKDHKRECEYEK